ncbi:Probable amidase At4g34880 [Linum perenne]
MAIIWRKLTTVALVLILLLSSTAAGSSFLIEETTIDQIQLAFSQNKLSSKDLVKLYIERIEELNPHLRSVLEVNPEALEQAEKADVERAQGERQMGALHGIPVLLKDSIGTKDKLNTTAGSYALLGSEVVRDAGVVDRLRKAGAVILGKASMSEWYRFRSFQMPNGWCARGGQAVNPYVEGADPCGSSSGPAISVAANMVAVAVGTETHCSILCPSDHNSVVGFKPTVGLTSRAGVIPVSPLMDTIGPICRTVSDAVYVLDAIVGVDPRDYEATKEAAEFIPPGGYKQFLKKDGLRGKRLGIVRFPFLNSYVNDSTVLTTFDSHLQSFRQGGATVVDDLEINNVDLILHPFQSGEMKVMMAQFKLAINHYLAQLVKSPVRSLADIIAFNINNPDLVCSLHENTKEYGQELFIAAEKTNGMGKQEMDAVESMNKLSEQGLEAVMKQHELDAMVTVGSDVAAVYAIGGYPGISVPAGYDSKGKPFGLVFGGLKGTEPKLIEISYAFEQATSARKLPFSFSSLSSLDFNHKSGRYFSSI